MHKLFAVVVVVLLLGITTAGFCQYNVVGLSADSVTARWMGMGGTGFAAANDEGALDFNPASLATMQLGKSVDAQGLTWGGSLTWGGGSFDELSPKIGVVKPSAGWGAGVSYEHASIAGDWTDDILQAGYGKNVWKGLNLGASYLNWGGMEQFNLGGLYAFPLKGMSPLRVGAVWQNVFGQNDDPGILNAGIALSPIKGLTLAADVYDVTQVFDPIATVGAEYCFCNGFALRAGDFDGAFTGGAGYRQKQWSLDVAYNQYPDHWFGSENSEQWTVTGKVAF